jgi:hypothetical protein
MLLSGNGVASPRPTRVTFRWFAGCASSGVPLRDAELGKVVALDLDSLAYKLPVIVLHDHNRDRIIGWADDVGPTDDGRLYIEGRVLDTPAGLWASGQPDLKVSVGTHGGGRGADLRPGRVGELVNGQPVGPNVWVATGWVLDSIGLTHSPADRSTFVLLRKHP